MKSRCLLFLGLVTIISSLAWAATETEEVTYDDLVNQLQQKRRRVEKSTAEHPLDHLQIHAGVGLISSTNRLEIPESRGERTLNGFQISVGIDLFSPEWVSEIVLRNFGTSERGSETRSLRELDLRAFYRGSLSRQLGYRLGGGLGTRYFRFADSRLRISRGEETPCFVGFGGFESYLSNQVSLGVELGARTALLDRSIDRSSFDLMVRLDTFF